MKPTVYVESSVIVSLTDRPDVGDPATRARNATTRQWWPGAVDEYDMVVSGLTESEVIGDAHPESIARRLAVLDGLERIPADESARTLGRLLHVRKMVPASELVDALHVAIASVARLDYLVTWDKRHLANKVQLPRIEAFLRDAGYHVPLIRTPEEL